MIPDFRGIITASLIIGGIIGGIIAVGAWELLKFLLSHIHISIV